MNIGRRTEGVGGEEEREREKEKGEKEESNEEERQAKKEERWKWEGKMGEREDKVEKMVTFLWPDLRLKFMVFSLYVLQTSCYVQFRVDGTELY